MDVALETPLLSALERIGCAGILLDAGTDVLAQNQLAEQLLAEAAMDGSSTRERLKALLRSAGPRFRLDSESWMMIGRDGRRPLALHAIPMSDGGDRYARTVLIIVDLETRPQPSLVALQRMFGLTVAEANLAIQISTGASPTEIAQKKNVTLATVRTQLAAIYAKTQTKRSADLVALLSRVAILPCAVLVASGCGLIRSALQSGLSVGPLVAGLV